ncbi:MAG: (2Fe-2S)-binding protein [Rhodocyclaceae bacterium]
MLGQSHTGTVVRGQKPRRRAGRRLRGVRLQRHQEDHHHQGHQGKGLFCWKKCASTPRPPVPAARAQGSSSKSSPRHGRHFQPVVAEESRCAGCTDYTHEEVRKAILENRLLSIPESMRFLEWRTPNGCPSCRQALNYYLLCAWPKEYRDDAQSRFINERAHANIQKDGSFSVVPRIYGGVTSPAELRRIAEVAEKYAVPTVKLPAVSASTCSA